MTDPESSALDPEDATLVALARAARGRAYVVSEPAEGAAVRDTEGRTYAGATVDHEHPALLTTALRAAVVAAASSGARGFEAAVVVADPAESADGEAGQVREEDLAMLRQFGAGARVLLVDADGAVLTRATS